MFVYVIVCSETQKIYIGQHKGNNLQKYLQTKFSDAHRQIRGRSYLYAAMRNHPRETWSIHSLVSDVSIRVELDELERHFIRVLKTQHPDVGYNICRGGEGFTGPASEETCRKHSESMKTYYAAGGPASDAHRQKSREHLPKLIAGRLRAGSHCGMWGKNHTVESRQRMSETHQGTCTGEQNPFFGKHHSEETNRKNAEAHRGCKASEETRKKMSEAHKARQARLRLLVSK